MKKEDDSNLKCVLCDMKAEYVQSGMSLCEKHFKAQQSADKEIDLMKIQIYAHKCHTFLTIGSSFAFVVFGLFTALLTLYYQSLMALNFYFVNVYNVGMTIISILFVTACWVFMGRYRRDIRRISKMVNKVQSGGHLPDLDKLHEWKEEKDC